MAWFVLVLSLVMAYVIGSINAAIIISKTFTKKDVRDYGSGNAGMTNVVRVMGIKLGVYTFIIDCLKGLTVGILAKYVAFPFIYEQLGLEAFRPEYAVYYCGFFCVIGHIYPIFFEFKGGKGVATVLGVLLACQYQTALIGLTIFVVLFIITRIVSVCSLSVVLVLPFINILFANGDDTYSVLLQCLLMAGLSILVIVMHTSNIVRIFKGKEGKLTIGNQKELDQNGKD